MISSTVNSEVFKIKDTKCNKFYGNDMKLKQSNRKFVDNKECVKIIA
jgi:hypothetical protein